MRVDWDSRDNEILSQVKTVVYDMLNLDEKAEMVQEFAKCIYFLFATS
jgi:hypothetical protein